jgi:glycosyltransferase involved in cell wall biosynthesis/2-polyprenyl-3-methyl-5-hydroxy-6-metoxy-1,4-benzoquinol methylase
MRRDIEKDLRLYGGIVHTVGSHTGVLYNADGECSEALATPFNTTIGILTRNRSAYLRDLINSIESGLTYDIPRTVIVNNTDDDTLSMLAREFPEWQAHSFQAAEYPETSNGLNWLRTNRPGVLPDYLKNDFKGFGPTNSIAWLRNQMFLRCKTRFLISFDDDMLLKPGWLDYLLQLQNRFYSFGVINNFAAFLIDTAVVKKIGGFDERFLRSHGYEDNDYLCRINEAKLRWVLGFNQEHDWRSAEEGNPRGSGTGSDLFIHRYAKRDGGFSASHIENTTAAKDPGHFGNWCWQGTKWKQVTRETGILDRPPFKGYYLERLVTEEPDWLTYDGSQRGMTANTSEREGRKITQNTPVEEIDIFKRPPTSTMIDRYVFLSHWCKGKRVLDAGCGHGYGAALLYALGAARVTGVDVDACALEKARNRYGREGLTFELVDVLNLDSGFHGQYDTAVCVEVFEHIAPSEIPSLIANLRSALAENGTIIFTTPRRKSREWDGRGGTHLYEYSCHEFQEILKPLLREAQLKFAGIQEFQIDGSPQWFSAWRELLDDSATVMVAVAENASGRKTVTRPSIPQISNTGPLGPLPRLSILLSNRNTLPFLKLALKSCREYLARPDHEIIVYDDASDDGSLEWLKENTGRYDVRVISNPGPVRKGIVFVYDELVRAASEPAIWLVHSDMFFAKGADVELWRNFGHNIAATCTRIEPPLYPEAPFRLLKEFGRDAATFREEEFLRFAEKEKNPGHTTTGIFAPIMMWRKDYFALGGHDKVFAPQSREDSDLFNRMHLAGLQFVQSWSSFCYHFSGRGSRRKDSSDHDSEEWRVTNSRNEKNFIRKWGTGVRHDQWLKPQVCRKRPVTLVGLLGSEVGNVISWLSNLEPYFDEIILVDDSSDGSADLARQYMEQECRESALVTNRKLHIIPRKLNGNYAAARNAGQNAATYDWVFQIDLDERLQPGLLEHLQEMLIVLEEKRKRVCGFPRLNTLDGAVVNDLPRTEWTPENLIRLRNSTDHSNLSVRNPDIQFRLARRDVRWTNSVHEVPEEVSAYSGGGSSDPIEVMQSSWILHNKTLLRQATQDTFYQKLFGNSGPHGSWDPRRIIERLERS